MSKAGLQAANEYGQRLPKFDDAKAAERELINAKDVSLAYLHAHYPTQLRYTVESLKEIEAWYFHCFENGNEVSGKLDRRRVERALAFYLGEVLVRGDSRYTWSIEPYAFLGGAFTIGVRRPGLRFDLMGFDDLWNTPNNKRRQSLYRKAQQFLAHK